MLLQFALVVLLELEHGMLVKLELILKFAMVVLLIVVENNYKDCSTRWSGIK